jgi:hypothetical protein
MFLLSNIPMIAKETIPPSTLFLWQYAEKDPWK